MSTWEVDVGPVLEQGEVASSVIAAIKELHPEAQVVDRGSYLRVLVAGHCLLSRAVVERHLGRAFHLPADLEAVMPSFRGKLAIGDDQATWTFGGPRP